MEWIAISALGVAVIALGVRLAAVQRSLTEARSVLVSLPEVAGRLEEVRKHRERKQREFTESDQAAARAAAEREQQRLDDYAKYDLTPPR